MDPENGSAPVGRGADEAGDGRLKDAAGSGQNLSYCQPGLAEIASRRLEERPALLATLAEQIRVELRAGIEHAVRAGALLIDAKAVVEHGQWLPWLRDNFGLSERSAQSYMRLSRDLAAMPATDAKRVALLPLREALASIADSRRKGSPTTRPQIKSKLSANAVSKTKAELPTQVHPDPSEQLVVQHDGEDSAELPRESQIQPRRAKRQSRASQWGDAVERASSAIQELLELQSEFQDWRENLPENLAASPVAEKLDAVVEIDLQSALDAINEAGDADLPLGFGRD